jgi:uncharacterized protein (TIGR02001 family)
MMTPTAGLFMRAGLALSAGLIAAPVTAADWSAKIGAVSDYRYRGVSLSGGEPAVQASLSIEHDSGAYADLWGSSLAPDGDSHFEFDGTVGFAFDLGENLSADLSATAYVYPGDSQANALELTTQVEANHGPLTANLGLSLAPPQRGTRDEQNRRRTNGYVFGGIEYALGDSPLSLHAGTGYELGPWDMTEDGGKWDWSLGAQADFTFARIALDYVGSDAGDDGLVGSIAFRF